MDDAVFLCVRTFDEDGVAGVEFSQRDMPKSDTVGNARWHWNILFNLHFFLLCVKSGISLAVSNDDVNERTICRVW